MHNMKRILGLAAAFLLLGAFAAYANGQGEQTNLSGTVSLIQSQPSGGTTKVILKTENGSYTLTLNQSLVADASLAPGKHISLKGLVHRSVDGAKQVEASEIEVDGQQYQVSQFPATQGIGSGASTGNIVNTGLADSSPDLANSGSPDAHRQGPESEKPEAKQSGDHPDSGNDG